jgi:hypothetical protein
VTGTDSYSGCLLMVAPRRHLSAVLIITSLSPLATCVFASSLNIGHTCHRVAQFKNLYKKKFLTAEENLHLVLQRHHLSASRKSFGRSSPTHWTGSGICTLEFFFDVSNINRRLAQRRGSPLCASRLLFLCCCSVSIGHFVLFKWPHIYLLSYNHNLLKINPE